MHWSEEIADKVIARNPHKEEYVCAAGISPSGSIHIGNFRDIATSYFVCLALRKKGKKAKLLFSWDEFDRLRKIPVNVAETDPDMEQYLGMPYADVKDPFGCHRSYAAHFEEEFESALARFGIEVDYRYQAREYRSGRYVPLIIRALQKRMEVFDILADFRTQEIEAGQREQYYPVSIYCPACGKDDVVIQELSADCSQAGYVCTCGYAGRHDFTKDFNCKLAWKTDWPMRWLEEQVDFEPGGKDHASPMGSYQTSRIIADKIFDYPAPLFQGYEFIGIKGSTGKMSGSSGLNLTPKTLLQIYQPEVILWLYAKTDPTRAFNFCFDEEILRQYFEFDKQYNDYLGGKADEFLSLVMDYSLIPGRTIKTVPMQQLVSFGAIVDFNIPMLETIFRKIGLDHTEEDFGERLSLARFWLEQCSPQSMHRLRGIRNRAYYEGLDEAEKQEIGLLRAYLIEQKYTLDELNAFLYSVPRQVRGELDDKANKSLQGKFFQNVYNLLLGHPKGPRLYLFLYAIELEKYISLLDFSLPPSKEELHEENLPRKKAPEGSKAPLQKPQISLDDFAKLDLRVCQVLACEEVANAQKLLRLTLDDGLDGRTIISSIKEDYRMQDLIGKKIIVIANLKPAKFAGVKSQGMLLAATADSCGCQVIFVDDAVPVGTQIS
ncbi:MAG: lysine--tRNA ligase [Clostridiales bacterium]|jgi:lysyl-tRNA synthetase class 1|nr:lysine--tRNA ligase [Clostridiales bacterium]